MTDYNDRIIISDDMGIYPTGDYTQFKNKYLEIIRIEKFYRKDQIVTIPDNVIEKSIQLFFYFQLKLFVMTTKARIFTFSITIIKI